MFGKNKNQIRLKTDSWLLLCLSHRLRKVKTARTRYVGRKSECDRVGQLSVDGTRRLTSGGSS